MKRIVGLVLLLGCISVNALAFDAFIVKDIRVEGLQRISAGTVFNYLPIKIGSEINSRATAKAIRALFKTGFFRDVRLEHDGDVLIVFVSERPAISKIELSGNEDFETEDLLRTLKDVGLTEGRTFNRSLLDRIQQELGRQYQNFGKYAVQIESEVTPLERNRVAIHIDIVEGDAARIKQINLVGNKVFSEKTLFDDFQLSVTHLLSFYTKDDQYSRQKLSADLETLRSHYLDRGYINFKILSTQVSITPDKQDIYITINISEGDVFRVNAVKLAGDLKLPQDDLFPAVKVNKGDIFSRKQATRSADAITALLSNEGYYFTNVNTVPDIDNEKKEVALTFFVDPGKRVYVRRINMVGNTKTRDEVLRREIRQLESAWISAKSVERSKSRLRRLGYFEEVNVETPAVPGTTDQVDINFKVKEKPSGNLLAGLGFSQSQGLIFNVSVSQENFLGTGKQIGFAFNNSDVNTQYSLNYTNPFYTVDGVSRGFLLSFRETDADEADISDFSTDELRAGVTYGIPLNEFDRVRVNFELVDTDVTLGRTAPIEVAEFLDDNGDNFFNYLVSVSWSHDTRNRAIFPTRGAFQALSGEITIPGSDLTYYKLSYRQQRYFPLTKSFTLLMKGDLGYGNAYGDTTELPFFENFFAGGVRSVRGFEDNSLGDRDSNNEPFGGNVKIVGNAELIFPVPFQADSKTVRMSAFFDVGNIYDDSDAFDLADLRASVGVAATWLSPVGPLTFSIAQPLREEDGDDVQKFQFSFGSAL